MAIDPGFALAPLFQASAAGQLMQMANPAPAPNGQAPYVGEGFINKMSGLNV